ncbi:helix-turn-helix domain-containing protein [Acutalibacter sp. 1XD8-33]|uniref:XRE family transcriptional regulator n=1 Tax=Acutalibacter sp. 1XD8-33 TaxID=2320081 RepID=UPI000EA01C9C|nr:XRE family transcriptional regulator [Acutalibacter sp. 1XD8-33]RKJ41083.1 helix-turn-helix domain-containing protein [Acutalibacter sp. 1XD8-33]
MSFPEKLKSARIAAGLTQQGLARQLGVDKTTYCGYETGRRQPDIAKLRQIIQALRISGDLLLETGSPGEVTAEELSRLRKYRLLDLHGKELADLVLEKEYDRMTHVAERQQTGGITYISCYDLAVSAGPGEPWSSDSGYKTRLEIPTEQVPENAHYCARVNGDSMEPAYMDGDIVFVERVEGAINEGEVGIFFLNGDGYIKLLGREELLSLNPRYAPIPLHDYDDLRCQGRVLGKL